MMTFKKAYTVVVVCSLVSLTTQMLLCSRVPSEKLVSTKDTGRRRKRTRCNCSVPLPRTCVRRYQKAIINVGVCSAIAEVAYSEADDVKALLCSLTLTGEPRRPMNTEAS